MKLVANAQQWQQQKSEGKGKGAAEPSRRSGGTRAVHVTDCTGSAYRGSFGKKAGSLHRIRGSLPQFPRFLYLYRKTIY
jgi:hypothetical protein